MAPANCLSPDSFVDAAFLAFDVATGNWTAFKWDLVSLLLPGVVGLGHVDEAYDAFRWADEVWATQYADNLEIQLFGFRGTGARAEHFIDTNPLIYAGHVGISFDKGKIIYGFSPYAPNKSFREVIDALKYEKASFPGQILDDTAVFHLAQDLTEQGYKTQVYVKSILVSQEEFFNIRRNIIDEVTHSPIQKRYSFPGVPGCYNCATWPSTHGVWIPETTGNLRDYIPELIKSGALPWRR